MGTLISDNSDSIHTSVFPIILYKSYIMTTYKHRDPFYLGNYVRIVAFTPVLRRASFSGVKKFL
jgi:hypothetical protein